MANPRAKIEVLAELNFNSSMPIPTVVALPVATQPAIVEMNQVLYLNSTSDNGATWSWVPVGGNNALTAQQLSDVQAAVAIIVGDAITDHETNFPHGTTIDTSTFLKTDSTINLGTI